MDELLLLKIIDFYPIAKFDGTADFCSSRCKVVTIILIILVWNRRRAICSTAIHCVVGGVGNRCFGDDVGPNFVCANSRVSGFYYLVSTYILS